MFLNHIKVKQINFLVHKFRLDKSQSIQFVIYNDIYTYIRFYSKKSYIENKLCLIFRLHFFLN